MRICFITSRYPTKEYPVNTFLAQLICQLADQGVECTVIAPHRSIADKLNGKNYKTPYYRVDTAKMSCDYFDYLKDGTPRFLGEYMKQYSWAEDTCAMLEFKQ